MKTLCAVILSVIVGFGLGILTEQSLAQVAPPAYVVTLFDSGLKSASDTDYPSLNPATFQPYGGHYIIHFGSVPTDGPCCQRTMLMKTIIPIMTKPSGQKGLAHAPSRELS